MTPREKQLKKMRAEIVKLGAAFTQYREKAETSLALLQDHLDELETEGFKPSDIASKAAEKLITQPAKPKKSKLTLHARIVRALYQRGPLTRYQLAYVAGISATSGPVSEALRELESRNILGRERDRYVLEQTDQEFFDTDLNLPAPERASELLDAFYVREGTHIEAILRAVMRLHSSDSRDAVCEEAGVSKTSGPTMEAFRRLKNLQILVSASKNDVTMSDWFIQINEPTIKVRDTATGGERLVSARTGKALE